LSNREPRIKNSPTASAGEFVSLYESTLRVRRKMGAAPSTVEAVMYELRTHGTEALKRETCQRRLSELSDRQLADVIRRLMKLRSQYSAITDKLITQLIGLSS
jgi:hypothetical protein